MANAQDLIERAETVVPPGTTVLAAGVFAVRDDHISNALAALGGSAVADALFDNAAAEGIGAAAGVRAAREANASRQGVSLRMLVVATPESILLFQLPAAGETPGEQLLTFTRSSTTVTISHFGASAHLDLLDGDKQLNLTGGVGLLAAYKDGNKKVLTELAR